MSVTFHAKCALIEAFSDSGITQAEFARRMKTGQTMAQRVLDPNHPTKIGQIEKALAIFGKGIEIVVYDRNGK